MRLSLLALFVYAILKAFLPLPSLEVVLIPLVIASKAVLLPSIIGAVGTFVGGGIGYAIAYFIGRSAILHFCDESQLIQGESLIRKYGVLAIFIGGVTPIPDFLLAYLAGLAKMPFFAFAISDALARFLRSLLIGYSLLSFGLVIDLERWGTVISLVIIAYLLLKWGFKRK